MGNCSEVAIDAYESYSTPLFSQRAVDIITNHSTNADTKDTPLFLYLAYQSVHSSNNGSSPGECPSFWTEPYKDYNMTSKRRIFAGMVSCMDSGIGNITNALQEYGYLKPDGNTIIIFSADNGGPTTTGDGIGSSNYPLRGGKHSIWEGGTRVTAWLWATPDIIPRTNNPVIGSNYTQLMHLVDWMPTILEAVNVSHVFPDSLALDGVSHWKGLSNGNNVKDKYFEFRDNVYYGYDDIDSSGGNPNSWSPKDDNGKGRNEERKSEGSELWEKCMFDEEDVAILDGIERNTPLYNLSNDYAERHDISKENEDLVNELFEEMKALRATGVPQASGDQNCPPLVNPVVDPVGEVWQPWC